MVSAEYLSQNVVNVLTVYLIVHYRLMEKVQTDALAVRHLEVAPVDAGASVAELLAWPLDLAA
ncbi:hypothetical protein PC121_g14926 [Phytophthora cactorum]|nr:hypothetical protein PC120_g13575 [Phytophthora cactorum]KAG3057261.1 hypothetical protein PC121_g14926 [Phytophthora cactorum]